MSRVLVIGGLPSSLVNFRGCLLKSMRDRGHEVIACASGDDDDVADWLHEIGIAYVSLPLKRTSLSPLGDLRLLNRLLALIREKRPDVVLAYTVKPVVFGMLAARLSGVRRRYALITGLGYAFIVDGSVKQRLISNLVIRLYRVALVGARTVFFQNNDDLALFRQQGILCDETRTLRTMGSGVDLKWFAPTKLPIKPIVFLLIARLLADKGIREYVEAARTIRRSHPDARFALLGSFDQNPSAISRAEIKRWIEQGVVEYWGEAKDVRPFLSRCSVYVLPSYREGMPRSVLEAMAMGRPVITTDVAGCRDTVVENLNGFLVQARDDRALAEAMRKCLALDASLNKMGSASRALAEQYFGVDSVNQILLNEMGL